MKLKMKIEAKDNSDTSCKCKFLGAGILVSTITVTGVHERQTKILANNVGYFSICFARMYNLYRTI